MSDHHLTIDTATHPTAQFPSCTIHGRCSCGTTFSATPTLPGLAQAAIDDIRRQHAAHVEEVARG